MSEDARSVALERRQNQAPALMADDELRRMYRVAESLALSGMFKEVTKAEQAFAKMVVGRDLGMSPAQAMMGLHLVEGSVMVHYAMLGRFIKARADEGYDYRAGWLKLTPDPRPDSERVAAGDDQTAVEFVWMDEDDPADMREVVGASVSFTIDGKQVGVSTYTIEDANAAGLIKPDKPKSAWNTSRRNMLLARAMSNGVKWYVPEVMGGLPIYVDGEIVPEKDSVTEPVGDGSGQGIDLGPKVDKVIARAEELGHAGLSNRAALELMLGNRAPGLVNEWVVRANAELDSFATEKAGEVPEAEVVDDKPLAETESLAEQGRPLGEQAQEDRIVQDMQTQVLETRLAQLEEARGEEQDPEQRALIDEEIDHVRHQLGRDEEPVDAEPEATDE